MSKILSSPPFTCSISNGTNSNNICCSIFYLKWQTPLDPSFHLNSIRWENDGNVAGAEDKPIEKLKRYPFLGNEKNGLLIKFKHQQMLIALHYKVLNSCHSFNTFLFRSSDMSHSCTCWKQHSQTIEQEEKIIFTWIVKNERMH